MTEIDVCVDVCACVCGRTDDPLDLLLRAFILNTKSINSGNSYVCSYGFTLHVSAFIKVNASVRRFWQFWKLHIDEYHKLIMKCRRGFMY